jgi:hypothetical protein
MLTVPEGDHLTLLNAYNAYIQSMSLHSSTRTVVIHTLRRSTRQELVLDQLHIAACDGAGR